MTKIYDFRLRIIFASVQLCIKNLMFWNYFLICFYEYKCLVRLLHAKMPKGRVWNGRCDFTQNVQIIASAWSWANLFSKNAVKFEESYSGNLK